MIAAKPYKSQKFAIFAKRRNSEATDISVRTEMELSGAYFDEESGVKVVSRWLTIKKPPKAADINSLRNFRYTRIRSFDITSLCSVSICFFETRYVPSGRCGTSAKPTNQKAANGGKYRKNF